MRRTSLPYDVILAMLTRQSPSLPVAPEENAAFEQHRTDAPRIGLRIVRSGEGSRIGVQDLLHG